MDFNSFLGYAQINLVLFRELGAAGTVFFILQSKSTTSAAILDCSETSKRV